VEEEGEVFRKGTVLLGPEEMEGEYAGEELRKEVRFPALIIYHPY
jgi:protein phosphatase 1 regulatory subunit 37